jgi:hypothetical protein
MFPPFGGENRIKDPIDSMVRFVCGRRGSHHRPAVYSDHLAGNACGSRPGEKANDPGNILRFSQSPHGNLALESFHNLRVEFFSHGRLDEAGSDGVASDPP